jgi:hypothetical protein
MKKIYFIICVFALMFTFISCEDSERKPQGDIRVTAPSLNVAQNSVWLRDSVGQPFTDRFLMRINWTEARFTCENGVPAEVDSVKYVLEMDVNDFSDPAVVAQTLSLYADLFSAPLRERLVLWYGGEIDTAKYVSLRVKMVYSSGGNGVLHEVVSNVSVLRVDPVKPVGTEDTALTIPEINIRFKQTTGSWAKFYVYSWSTGGADNIEEFGGWPGRELHPDGESWYSLTVPGSRPIHIILNNNSGAQWDFVDNPTIDDDGDYEINTDTKTKNKL